MKSQTFDISSISQLKELINLNLEANYIEDISTLKSLTKLDVSGNLISSYIIALPNLVELGIGCNKYLNDTSGLLYSLLLSNLSTINFKGIDLELYTCGKLFNLSLQKMSLQKRVSSQNFSVSVKPAFLIFNIKNQQQNTEMCELIQLKLSIQSRFFCSCNYLNMGTVDFKFSQNTYRFHIKQYFKFLSMQILIILNAVQNQDFSQQFLI
ncbi:Leucine-rich_repeat domain superfamily [Hexamita inflata]|uniref:Leucine-rich repeat domain superfamily n=1 Tax=Hexamita inflata TaxID=28002 RepID=A0AA86Q5Z2_9EUKA|nr:Leucine-rich repeat domain superfamily [Hexamita inflata]CAI9953024.1 Leucine-rich repeat domain superfamily [Hexamita inflata]